MHFLSHASVTANSFGSKNRSTNFAFTILIRHFRSELDFFRFHGWRHQDDHVGSCTRSVGALVDFFLRK